jgi:hypothetical protein
MTPKEIFLKHWNSIKDPKSRGYIITDKFSLQNGKIAEIAIHFKEECIGFGNNFDELKLPNKEDERYYFHANDGFIGSGTHSKFWFYFDKNNVILNDHKYAYPYDELMSDFDDFFQRLHSDI